MAKKRIYISSSVAENYAYANEAEMKNLYEQGVLELDEGDIFEVYELVGKKRIKFPVIFEDIK